MISFWRSYGVSAALSLVTVPAVLALFLVGYGLLDGAGLPGTEEIVWASAFAIFLFLPLMWAVDLAVSGAWVLWRRSAAQSVVGLGSQAALIGTVAAFVVFLAYRSVW